MSRIYYENKMQESFTSDDLFFKFISFSEPKPIDVAVATSGNTKNQGGVESHIPIYTFKNLLLTKYYSFELCLLIFCDCVRGRLSDW